MEDSMSKKLDLAMAAVAVLVVIVLGWQYAHRGTPNETPAAPAATESGTSTPDEAKLAGMKTLSLASGLESWTPEAKIDDQKVLASVLRVKGKVAAAYLSARATTDGKALTKWDSLYFRLNDLGGHLFRPQSLPVPAGEGTNLLFDLYDVPYLPTVPYSEDREPERANMLALFVPDARLYLTSFISSLTPSRLEDLTIHYRCADDSDCAITTK